MASSRTTHIVIMALGMVVLAQSQFERYPFRLEINVQPPYGVILLKCTSNMANDQIQGPFNFTSAGGSMVWEFTAIQQSSLFTTWTCWANWGQAVLLRNTKIGGFPFHQGFNVFGSNFVESVPNHNNTWLINEFGRTRTAENRVPIAGGDYMSSWDGIKPLP